MTLRLHTLRPRDLLLPAMVAVPALFAAFAGPANAQANSQAAQMIQKACGSDIKKLCADVQPGGGRIMQCMKANEAELSNTCKSALATAKTSAGR